MTPQRHRNATRPTTEVPNLPTAKPRCSIATRTPPHTATAGTSRLFATDAVTGGLPVHIAARVLGHHNLSTTQSYLAVFQDELVRAYRAFLTTRRALRPAAEYRQPTNEE